MNRPLACEDKNFIVYIKHETEAHHIDNLHGWIYDVYMDYLKKHRPGAYYAWKIKRNVALHDVESIVTGHQLYDSFVREGLGGGRDYNYKKFYKEFDEVIPPYQRGSRRSYKGFKLL